MLWIIPEIEVLYIMCNTLGTNIMSGTEKRYRWNQGDSERFNPTDDEQLKLWQPIRIHPVVTSSYGKPF